MIKRGPRSVSRGNSERWGIGVTVEQLTMAVGLRDAAKIVVLKGKIGHIDAAYRGQFDRLALRPVAEIEQVYAEVRAWAAES
jgi:hypothetical protein